VLHNAQGGPRGHAGTRGSAPTPGPAADRGTARPGGARASQPRARHAQPCPGVRRRPGSLWRRPCCSGARVQVQGAVQSAAAPPNGTCVQESPLPLRRGLVPSGGTACQDARATQRSKRQAETLSSSTQKPCCGLKAVRAGIQHRGDPPLDSFRPRAAGAVRRASRCCWRRPRC